MTCKILIITDGKSANIESVNQYLSEHGYEVIVAYDGIDGFNMARNKKPDLILIDTLLSSVNGYQICSLLKFDIKFEDIVVVILTDGDGPKYRQLSDNSGADGILVKPIDLNELMGIVRSVNLKV